MLPLYLGAVTGGVREVEESRFSWCVAATMSLPLPVPRNIVVLLCHWFVAAIARCCWEGGFKAVGPPRKRRTLVALDYAAPGAPFAAG